MNTTDHVRNRNPRRKWLLRALTLALSLAPFALLELGLRWTSPAVEVDYDHDPFVDLHQLRPLFELNQPAGRWEIPEHRLNFFRPDSFLANKPESLRRIFVLGGSTVQGRPYAIETSMSTWLRLRLEAADPDSQFEVINCGGVSYASYRVAKILDEVLQHEPDAIVLYTGHNEFLEDREYAELRNLSPPLQVIQRLASQIRTVTWLQERIGKRPLPRSTMHGEVNARLDHAGGLDKYQRDPLWQAGVEGHFAKTMQSMIDAASAANVPLILCEPAGDVVRTPPFKVTLPPEIAPDLENRFNESWKIAQNAERSSRQRLSAARECLKIDPRHAGAHYLVGRMLYDQDDPLAAAQHLLAARDFDVCPLRATTSIIDAVVTLSAARDLPLVRTHQIFDQRNCRGERSPDNIVDPEFFVDHLHPTISGHQAIAAEIVTHLQNAGWIDWSPEAEKRYRELASEHLNNLGPEYYARGRQRLEGLRRWAAGRAGGTIVVPNSD